MANPVDSFMRGFMVVDQLESNRQERAFRSEQQSWLRKSWRQQESEWERQRLDRYRQEKLVEFDLAVRERVEHYGSQIDELRAQNKHKEADSLAMTIFGDHKVVAGKVAGRARLIQEAVNKMVTADPTFGEHVAMAVGLDPAEGELIKDKLNPVSSVSLLPGELSPDGKGGLVFGVNALTGPNQPLTENRTASNSDPIAIRQVGEYELARIFGPGVMGSEVLITNYLRSEVQGGRDPADPASSAPSNDPAASRRRWAEERIEQNKRDRDAANAAEQEKFDSGYYDPPEGIEARRAKNRAEFYGTPATDQYPADIIPYASPDAKINAERDKEFDTSPVTGKMKHGDYDPATGKRIGEFGAPAIDRNGNRVPTGADIYGGVFGGSGDGEKDQRVGKGNSGITKFLANLEPPRGKYAKRVLAPDEEGGGSKESPGMDLSKNYDSKTVARGGNRGATNLANNTPDPVQSDLPDVLSVISKDLAGEQPGWRDLYRAVGLMKMGVIEGRDLVNYARTGRWSDAAKYATQQMQNGNYMVTRNGLPIYIGRVGGDPRDPDAALSRAYDPFVQDMDPERRTQFKNDMNLSYDLLNAAGILETDNTAASRATFKGISAHRYGQALIDGFNMDHVQGFPGIGLNQEMEYWPGDPELGPNNLAIATIGAMNGITDPRIGSQFLYNAAIRLKEAAPWMSPEQHLRNVYTAEAELRRIVGPGASQDDLADKRVEVYEKLIQRGMKKLQEEEGEK